MSLFRSARLRGISPMLNKKFRVHGILERRKIEKKKKRDTYV